MGCERLRLSSSGTYCCFQAAKLLLRGNQQSCGKIWAVPNSWLPNGICRCCPHPAVVFYLHGIYSAGRSVRRWANCLAHALGQVVCDRFELSQRTSCALDIDPITDYFIIKCVASVFTTLCIHQSQGNKTGFADVDMRTIETLITRASTPCFICKVQMQPKVESLRESLSPFRCNCQFIAVACTYGCLRSWYTWSLQQSLGLCISWQRLLHIPIWFVGQCGVERWLTGQCTRI